MANDFFCDKGLLFFAQHILGAPLWNLVTLLFNLFLKDLFLTPFSSETFHEITFWILEQGYKDASSPEFLN